MNSYRITVDFRRGQPFTGRFSGQNSDHAIAAALAAARENGLTETVARITVGDTRRQRGEI